MRAVANVSSMLGECCSDGGGSAVGRWADGGGVEVPNEEEGCRQKIRSKCIGGSMSGATIEQVNLMLKLYDARREAKL